MCLLNYRITRLPNYNFPYQKLLRRVSADVGFVAVGCRGAGLRIGFRGLPGRVQSAGAVVALLFYVVVLRQRRDQSRSRGQLADPLQNDFGAAVVEFYRTMDFNDLSRQASDVAYIFEVVREDHDSKWASQLIFAEVDEVHTSGADFHAQDFSRHALDFSDVLFRVANGEAVGGDRCCG